jgi:RNA polymerase sigma factor (sigma-70 family)
MRSSRHSLDDSTLAALYRRHRAELCSYVARTFGRGPPEPDDVVQSTFVQYAALPNPSALINPRAFLFRIAHNTAVEYRRREATHSRIDQQRIGPESAASADELDGERVLLAKERCRIIEQAIRGMDATRSQLLIMHRIHELSFAEISRRTGISQTHVKRLVADAIVECNDALRRTFRSEEP